MRTGALEGRKAQHGLHQAFLRLHTETRINLGRGLFRRVARRTPIQGESLSQVGSTHANAPYMEYSTEKEEDLHFYFA